MGFYLLMFHGVRSSMMVQTSGVESLASGFRSPSYSNIKTSLSAQHRRQNPWVNGETTLHSQDHLKRFTELYRKEKREVGDRGDWEEKRESQKGREQSKQ